ncbi:MAG: DUF4179 domain-containing protein [Lachnospiraceae bacterium]|nr:DUF4179 domain-containing protein [Lachnospiraceae bacterium]
MSRIYKVLNHMKTQIPEENFSELDHKKMRKAALNITRNHKEKRRKKLAAVAACFALICALALSNQTVSAYVREKITGVLAYLNQNEGYQAEQIGDSGLLKPLTQTKNGFTVTLNQFVCSDSEVFIDYSLSAQNLRKHYGVDESGQDYIDASIQIQHDGKNVTEQLFSKSGGGMMTNDVDNPQLAKNTGSDTNTVEIIDYTYGEGFLFENKDLDVEVNLYQHGEKIGTYHFPVTVKQLFDQKKLQMHKEIADMSFTKATSSVYRMHVYGTYKINKKKYYDAVRVQVYDEDGKQLLNSSSTVDDNGVFEEEFIRNRSDDSGKYTIQVNDEHGKMIDSFEIELN